MINSLLSLLLGNSSWYKYKYACIKEMCSLNPYTDTNPERYINSFSCLLQYLFDVLPWPQLLLHLVHDLWSSAGLLARGNQLWSNTSCLNLLMHLAFLFHTLRGCPDLVRFAAKTITMSHERRWNRELHKEILLNLPPIQEICMVQGKCWSPLIIESNYYCETLPHNLVRKLLKMCSVTIRFAYLTLTHKE